MLAGDFFCPDVPGVGGMFMDDKRPGVNAGFVTGPIALPLLRFALPLMLSLLLQALYGGVDLAVVGRFAQTESVSAVATGSQVMQAITVLITGLTMGVTVLIGKFMGAGDARAAGDVVSAQVKLCAGVAVVLTAIMVALAPQAARLMNVPEAAVAQTVSYVRVCSGGIVFITAYNAISGIFRGLGNSRSPFLFVAIACVANIVLDLLFVGGLGMAATGAALATVLAQALSVAFSLGYMRRHPLPFEVSLRAGSARSATGILKIGSPIALQDFLNTVSFLIITSIVNSLGLIASAGIGISEKLFVFLSIVPMSFMSALSAFVAQNMGAPRPGRARLALRSALMIALALGVPVFAATHFAGGTLAALFSSDADVVAATAEYLRGSSFEYLMIPVTFCLLGYFNGREHTAFTMIQGLLASFLVRIPLSYLLSRVPGTSMWLISLAVPASSMANMALCVAYYVLLRRRERVRGEE